MSKGDGLRSRLGCAAGLRLVPKLQLLPVRRRTTSLREKSGASSAHSKRWRAVRLILPTITGALECAACRRFPFWLSARSKKAGASLPPQRAPVSPQGPADFVLQRRLPTQPRRSVIPGKQEIQARAFQAELGNEENGKNLTPRRKGGVEGRRWCAPPAFDFDCPFDSSFSTLASLRFA